MLDPLVGSSLASLLFGIALLASGQSSTFIRLTGDRRIMGSHANGRWLKPGSWALFLVSSVANLWLLCSLL